LSIAWAVIEYISNSKLLGAKTLFATHYHELTELEGKIENVNNYCIAVKEKGDDIIFLRKIEGLGLTDYDCGVIAAGALMQYLVETQKRDLSHISHLTIYASGKYMLLDSSTRRNLELCETLRDKQKRGSLLWVLDKTKTAMGARTLRKYIEQPLIDKSAIEKRLDAVDELVKNAISREEIREYLSPVYDLERLVCRITYQSANPRDLIAFQSSLAMLPHIKYILNDMQTPLLKELNEELDTLGDLCKLVSDSIKEDPPIAMKEGGIIKDGYNAEVDKLRNAKSDGKDWLAKLETEEREKTGIKNLRIKYNKVFGYYLEVTNSFKNLVPDYYTRKQTLANAERYIIPELKELEDTILGAEDKLYALEYQLYSEVRDTIGKEVVRIQKTAKAIAKLDAFASLALVAEQNNYVRPKMNDKGLIDIKDGRHPVVEKMISNDMFICNDTYLNDKKERILLVECRKNAERTSSRSIPQPLSVIRMNEIPPSLISTTTAVAPASMAFSTSSFTTEAGRSITSPAAILSIVIGSNT
jgi:DNA mismatch repair protein MutS